jgi:hypothetical protein
VESTKKVKKSAAYDWQEHLELDAEGHPTGMAILTIPTASGEHQIAVPADNEFNKVATVHSVWAHKGQPKK